MKGKILRCYILNGSYCKEGAPRLSSVGIPVGRPTILLFEGLKKLSLNSVDMLKQIKKNKKKKKNGSEDDNDDDDDMNKDEHHNDKLIPFLRLKAINRQEHDSWIMILKQIVNKSIIHHDNNSNNTTSENESNTTDNNNNNNNSSNPSTYSITYSRKQTQKTIQQMISGACPTKKSISNSRGKPNKWANKKLPEARPTSNPT